MSISGCTVSSVEAGRRHIDIGSTLNWGHCDEHFTNYMTTIGIDNSLADRVQCTTLSVPLDYNDPDGRQIELAISRVQSASGGEASRSLFLNPGGPGLEGRSMPAIVESVAQLPREIDLIGFDVRGTGASETHSCPELDNLEPPDITDPEAAAATYARSVESANIACVERDRPYFEQLTVENAAHDMDQIRAAIGQDALSYYGASWGTSLGAVYRSYFPDHVRTIALDSMNYLGDSTVTAQADIARAQQEYSPNSHPALMHNSDDLQDELSTVAPELEQGPEPTVTIPAINPLTNTTRTALICNTFSDVGTAEQQWKEQVHLAEEFAFDYSDRIALPGSSELAGLSLCTGWPLRHQQHAVRDTNTSLLIIGHEREVITPYIWAVQAHQQLGGELLTITDADHGSALGAACSSTVLNYLSTGKVNENRCDP
ncbi:alpha/beta fold hydrolase [Rhodococcus qingshengii]|uniref:alpha/beta fold hydrolase n=1 Tax=Rhodococcus qingshengii TaxID=334542 RepID=UPI003664FF53